MVSNPQLKSVIKEFQRNEITENVIYLKLAKSQKNEQNQQVLRKIAEEEFNHYKYWKTFTNEEVKPDKWKVFKYTWIAKILGITFAIKLMEKGESKAQMSYASILLEIPDVKNIISDEDKHEKQLIDLIKEEKLNYVGSIVLGIE
jgi:rubrerythrin